jgi:hypothetical protein
MDQAPSSDATPEPAGWLHRWLIAKPAHRVGHYVLTALMGVAALAIGLLFLVHPVAYWPYGAARGSDAPPAWGVGLLVFPVILVGLGVRRLWWALELDVEALRERRERRERRRRA